MRDDKSWAAQRAARIRREIPILDVLANYGYAVRADGGERQQQFSCNLHGDGFDVKPSARVYPQSNDWHCWACDLSRGAIETTMANEGLEFWPAVELLERRYGLPALQWSGPTVRSVEEVARENLRRRETFSDTARRYHRLLDAFTQERDIALPTAVRFWEALDKVVWHVEKGGWTEDTGQKVLGELLGRLREAFR